MVRRVVEVTVQYRDVTFPGKLGRGMIIMAKRCLDATMLQKRRGVRNIGRVVADHRSRKGVSEVVRAEFDAEFSAHDLAQLTVKAILGQRPAFVGNPNPVAL